MTGQAVLQETKWLWDLITSPDIEEMTVGLPDRARIYPLNVSPGLSSPTRGVFLQLQFCDLLAGATAVWCRQFLGRSYAQDYVEQLGGSRNREPADRFYMARTPELTPETLGMKGWSGGASRFSGGTIAQARSCESSVTDVIACSELPWLTLQLICVVRTLQDIGYGDRQKPVTRAAVASPRTMQASHPATTRKIK